MSTLLLFFDGVGIGRDDPGANPFAAIGARRLSTCAGREPDPAAAFRPLDATLGVPGLPQSATGQTTLYTGVNAARLLGRHLPGLPGPALLPLLEERSLFVRMTRAGLSPTFANAYNRGHLETRRPRWSATTRMVMASGVPFRMIEEEARRGEALFHDYAGDRLLHGRISAPAHDARGAARVLSGLAERHDLVLYEYFQTDLAGHRGTAADRVLQARRAEELVGAVLDTLDLGRHRLVVISDHGNLEESDHDLHTRNPTPLLAWGRGADGLVGSVERFEDLTPALEWGQTLPA